MYQAMIEGLQLLFNWQVLLMIVIGIVVSQVVAVIPGLSGSFITAMMVPFAVVQDPVPGLALIIATMTCSGTGNTVTSVFFGVPGSGSGVGSVFDGHPMAKKGLGQRAVSAGLMASLVGGLIGAVAMGLILPAVRPIVLALGPPEFFALIMVAMVFLGYVGEGTLARGLVSGLLGMLIGVIGLEPTMGSPRFTFGWLYLYDGVPLVPFLLGLYAICGMMEVMRRGGAIVRAPERGGGMRQTKAGILDATVRHWDSTLRSSLIGVGIGLLPGMGGAAAQFIGYGAEAKAKQGRTEVPFGQGAIEGVIAADAGVNSKDGGQFIPSLVFGIPGSAEMALLLAAMIGMGFQPGPSMLRGDGLAITWMVLWILVLSNIGSTTSVIAASRPLAKLAAIRGSVLVPIILCVSVVGAFADKFALGDLVIVFGAGLLGYYMRKHGYSRATMVIGFVLAPLAERYFFLSFNLHDWAMLTQPIVLAIFGGLALSMLLPVLRQRWRRGRSRPEAGLDSEGEEASRHG